MTRLRAWAPAAVLVLGVLLAYGGPLALRLGFYHDDWWFLSVLHFAPGGFAGRLSALLADSRTLLLRPLDAPALAGLYTLFGVAPLGWQAAVAASVAAGAFGAERLLRLYGAPPRLALLGALLALAYPNKEGAMFWPMAGIVAASFSLFVWATVHHVEWVKDGDRRRLAASAACLAASLGFYDQSFFQTAAWALLPFAAAGDRRRRLAQGLALAAAVTVLFAAYKFVVVPKVFGVVFNKTLVLDPRNAAVVLARGLWASLGWEMAASALGAAWALFVLHPLVACAAAALPWAVRRFWPEGPDAEPGAARRLALFGGALFFLGYLPIMVSDYRPTPFSHMNRINYVPAFGLALAAAAAALGGPRRGLRTAAFAGLASLCLAAHGGFAGYWAESRLWQERARAAVLAKRSEWPAGTTLLFNQPTLMVGRRAPVFLASWDSTGAVRVWTGDASRTADALRPGARLSAEGVHLSQRLFRFDDVRVLDVGAGSIGPMARPGQD